MASNGKLVCVTGASGYIASWLVKLLLQGGYTVNATVRDPVDPKKTEHLRALDGARERLHFFKANLLDQGSFDAVVDGCECVFHTASPFYHDVTDPQVELIDPAVKGTLNVLGSCTKSSSIKRVVVTSSTAAVVYNGKPRSPEVIVDETWFSDPELCKQSKSWYVLSKTLAEEAAWKFSKENGIDMVTINPAMVIGPLLQPTLNTSAAAILNLINGASKFANAVFGWVDVKDVAKAHILAYEVPSASGRYCLVERVVHHSEIVKIIQELYPSLQLPKEAQSWVLQDHILRDSGTYGMDADFDRALDRLRDTIPAFDLNSFTNKDTVPPKAQHALASAIFSKIVEDMEVKFDMTARQRAVFRCLQGAHAQDFLLAIPIDGLGQHMSPVEYRSILRYRLMIPLFPVDEICPVCRKACLDTFGEHVVHCKELPGFKYRHDLVRDVLFDVLRRAGISAKKEAPVNFLTDPQEGRSTLRPADVLVYGWIGGRHACVDLTGVSPLVGLGSGNFIVGQAALRAASAKVAKHEKACIDNQHAFIPFAFDTFGFLAPDAVELLKRVQRVMHSNIMTPRSVDLVFKRIGFAIQKGVAAQLVARLPFISV